MLWKNKETGTSMGLFLYFPWGIDLQTVVVIEIPEWILKAKLARKTIFEKN